MWHLFGSGWLSRVVIQTSNLDKTNWITDTHDGNTALQTCNWMSGKQMQENTYIHMIFLDPFDQSYMSFIDSYLSFVITTNTSPFRIHPPIHIKNRNKKSDRESYSSKVLLTSWNFFGSKGITLFQANRLFFFPNPERLEYILRCFFFPVGIRHLFKGSFSTYHPKKGGHLVLVLIYTTRKQQQNNITKKTIMRIYNRNQTHHHHQNDSSI